MALRDDLNGYARLRVGDLLVFVGGGVSGPQSVQFGGRTLTEDPRALEQIRQLAYYIYEKLPQVGSTGPSDAVHTTCPPRQPRNVSLP